MGIFFPRKLKEIRVRKFLSLKNDSVSVQNYGMKFTQLSHYALEIVKDMRSSMSLFVAGLGHASTKEGRASMFIGDMEISWLMVYAQ